jgi:hypothetical protein
VLNHTAYRAQLDQGKFAEIAAHAVRIESRTNLLFSFRKNGPARRGEVRGRRALVRRGPLRSSLRRRRVRGKVHALASSSRGAAAKADASSHLADRAAACKYGFDFQYKSKPSWNTYNSLLNFAEVVGRDLYEMKPEDRIDIQSFIWVQRSGEYPE